MPYELYKVLHIIGVLLVIGSLSAMCLHVLNGGDRNHKSRKLVAGIHGLGLLIVLVAGFGLLARLGLVQGLPSWAIAKLVIWIILGGIPALIYRKKNMAGLFWACVFAFAALAAYLAIYKPF